MDQIKRYLYWLLDGTRGGPMRLRLLSLLSKKPMNLRQLALSAGVDYSTVEHHIHLLEKHYIVECIGEGYGKQYALSETELVRDYILQKENGDKNEIKINAKRQK